MNVKIHGAMTDQSTVAWPQDRWRSYERLVLASWTSTPGRGMDDPVARGPHLGLALAGEAGEVVELIKKAHRLRDDAQVPEVRRLLDELGDVLWAITSIALWAGHSLDDVALVNEVKMRTRHGKLPAVRAVYEE